MHVVPAHISCCHHTARCAFLCSVDISACPVSPLFLPRCCLRQMVMAGRSVPMVYHSHCRSFTELYAMRTYFLTDQTRNGLAGSQIESRWGARYSTYVQTGPGAHPACYTMGSGLFPGVKWPGRGAYHPLPSSAEVQEKIDLYLYCPSGA